MQALPKCPVEILYTPAFPFESVNDKIDNLRPMNRPSRFWLGIALTAFLVGVAIGRFGLPNRIEKSVAQTKQNFANPDSSVQTNAPTATVDNSSSKKIPRTESNENSTPKDD